MDTALNRTMFSNIEIFCLVAEQQSFSNAAHQAGLTPAAVSRSIARLEQRLGLQLFSRTTRKVRLTQAGEEYFFECKQVLKQIIAVEQRLKNDSAQLSGIIRISLPTPFGHFRVLPLLPKFQRLYPEIKFEIQLTNKNVDFITEGFDLAIRGRNIPDSNLIARRLENADLLIVASPEYLKKNGIPSNITDLQHHQCIQYLLPSTGKALPWSILLNQEIMDIQTQGYLSCNEDILATITLARYGAGLLQTCRFAIEDDLKQGQLIEVLQQYAGAQRPFSLLYPKIKYEQRHIRLFIDFLIEHLSTSI
ncbi:LysR family transcriptional regulator [Acinetobacter bereziniae]|uniref:LysR family transcriptional regulator n=1 Tax=Acinetobacter bereziniae TaxID=106648 RepID=UPI0012506FAD|nr:LysR family transcriptional regulator [Acinetobacter bereziniae]